MVATLGLGPVVMVVTDSKSLAAYSASFMSLGSRMITCLFIWSCSPFTYSANFSVSDLLS